MIRKKKVIKRRFKWKTFLKFLIFLGVCSLLVSGILNIPTKQIIITGNEVVSDKEIIMASQYQFYPKLFSKRYDDIKNDILNLDYVSNVKIHRSLFGVLKLEITEDKPLFYNKASGKLVLMSGKEIDSSNYDGVPILINNVPEPYYERFISKLSQIKRDVLMLISEIQYDPWKSNDITIDETRFVLRMNDGNIVYVNLIHMDKLDNYIEIFASLENQKGTLYLDSSSDKISFSLNK